LGAWAPVSMPRPSVVETKAHGERNEGGHGNARSTRGLEAHAFHRFASLAIELFSATLHELNPRHGAVGLDRNCEFYIGLARHEPRVFRVARLHTGERPCRKVDLSFSKHPADHSRLSRRGGY